MERMRDAELQEPARERQDDVARRDAVIDVLLVEVQPALVELEGADAARIDHLHRDSLRGVHGPGDVVLDLLEVALFRDRAQHEVVAAEHDERALVEERCVSQLEMRLARVGRQHRGFEAGGVAHLGVAIAGNHRGGQRVPRAGARERGVCDLVVLVVLRHQRARDRDLAAADVGVRVDGARHDDLAAEVVLLVDARFRRRGHDAAVGDVDVAHLAVHAIGRVVQFSARQLDHHRNGARVQRAASMAASTSAARGSCARSRFLSGNDTTLSQRTMQPA